MLLVLVDTHKISKMDLFFFSAEYKGIKILTNLNQARVPIMS